MTKARGAGRQPDRIDMEQYFEFIANHPFLSLAFVVILALLLRSIVASRVSGVKEVAPQEAIRLINQQDAAVVDVRLENEFRDGHILNAVNAPLGSLDAKVKDLNRYKDKPIILNCRSGQRSAQAARILRKHGFEQVYNLAGGLMAWEKAELPLAQGGKKNR